MAAMSAPGSTVTADQYHAVLNRRDATIAALQRDVDSARQGYVARGECLARVQLEARAIADALGERGLVDFADDVRLLARLAGSV